MGVMALALVSHTEVTAAACAAGKSNPRIGRT